MITTALIIGVVILFGIIFLAIEIFLVPGFSVPGIAGCALIGYAVYLAYTDFGFTGAFFSISLSGIISALLIKHALKSKTMHTISLSQTHQGHVAVDDYNHLSGKTGVALTDLRPAGSAEITGERYDVVTDGEYIDEKSEIIVNAIEGSHIIVTIKERH